MEENILHNADFGLNTEEVQQRIKAGKSNKIKTKTSKSYAKILIGNLCTWFNLICFIITGILIAVNSFENLTFLLIFLANLFIGLIQEIRAKRMVDNISVIINTKVKVLRNGKKMKADIDKVVQDDIVFFATGDQICCDCKLIEGRVEVNESLLTGESKPVKKNSQDLLLGGSYVVSGECKAVAIKVGMENYSSTLIKKAREFKKNKSDILRTLNIIIKTIGIILIPLGILNFFDLKSSGYGIDEALIKASASIIGMMPVGMFLLTSVSLVVGVIKLARKKALVQELYSIETLARVDVLCLDKTGTLTDGTMSVNNVIPLDYDQEEIKKIVSNLLKVTKANNQTQIALKEYFGSKGNFELESSIEFSSERKFSAVSFKEQGTFMLGAPEFVTKNLTDEQKQTIKDLSSSGLRVLILCKHTNKIKDDKISNNSTPIAIISIQDNIRSDAKDTISWFNNNGVEIKVISGDNVDTVRTISKKVGIVNAGRCISLENKSDEEVAELALKYNVFGRVSPEQKCIIIKTLKANNKKVAMTGDGVNDILALKEADCSIAMASGSEATRSASDLVMLDNNFSSMPNIVAEGRRVINNISKASSLFLTKTLFTLFLTIFVLISPSSEYPLQPNQILLWETLFIGIPAFLLALQPNNNKISGSFIGSLTSKALPAAFVLFLAAMACYVYCSVTQSMYLIDTLISYSVTFGAFFILLNLCLPLDKFRAFVTISLLITAILGFIILPKDMFNYNSLASSNFIFLIAVLVCVSLLYSGLKLLLEKFFKLEKLNFNFKKKNR